LIHWKNIRSKFFAFTVRGKWKQIWANSHTVLGVIGLPFQILYAVTGALFGLVLLLLAPTAFVLFEGDTDKVLAIVRPERAIAVNPDTAYAAHPSLNTYYQEIKDRYPAYQIFSAVTSNYGHVDAITTYYFDDIHALNGQGHITYQLVNGEIKSQLIPENTPYTYAVQPVLFRFHFGRFGGLGIKIIFFVLALITCYMFISGILLWQEARNNNRYTAKQKAFHHKVTKVNLAICLGLFPAVACIFLANKLIPLSWTDRITYVNSAFFGSWAALILMGLRWNDFRLLNINYLKIGGILSLGVPIINGIQTGDWFWMTATSDPYVFSVDLFWIGTGVSALIVPYLIINRKLSQTKEEKIFEKAPISHVDHSVAHQPSEVL